MSRLVLAALFSLSFLLAASAEPLKEPSPRVSVIGEASEDVDPDQATLTISVVTDKPGAADAATENAQKSRSVIEDLIRQGVDAKDIHTESFTLVPLYPDEPPSRLPPGKRVAKGYRARNELGILVKSIEKAGALLQRAIDSGSNEVQSVRFSIKDETAHLEKLRLAAIASAERRARTYAEAVGAKLGHAIDVTPEPDAMPSGANFRIAAAAAPQGGSGESIPLRPSPQKLTARVAVTWALSQ